MRKVALLYNPDSGGTGRRRLRELESAMAVLRGAGLQADLVPTESRFHAGEQTRKAIESGCDTIFACGGDGTINNIAQSVVNTPVALAILPMGTANILAHDLNLPLGITAAAKAALRGQPRQIAVGHISYVNLKDRNDSRYFVAVAGMGVDAHLFYKLNSGTKHRMGMAAYYTKAWQLCFTYPMTRFLVDYVEEGSAQTIQTEVTELMAVRIRNFGGVLQELATGASLERNDVRLVFSRTESRMAYVAYVARGLLRRKWKIPGIDLAWSTKAICTYRSPAPGQSEIERKIYVEADGELLGTLPAEITVVPEALTLIAPTR